MKALRNAVWVAGTYLGVGVLWILGGDRLSRRVAGSLAEMSRFETLKGLLFVGLTTALLFWVAYALFRATTREAEARLQRRETLLRLDRDVLAGLSRWSVAHDLRNLLTLVSGATDLVRRADGDPEALGQAADDLDHVRRSGLALAERLVGPPEEPPEAAPVPVDLRALVIEADQAVAWHLALKVTRRVIAEGPPVPVLGRPEVLRHALAHLLLLAGHLTQGQGRIEVQVGSGTGKALVEVLARPPEGAHPPPEPEPLGLVLAREAAEAHHGRLDVRPADAGGTRFCFTLPRADAPASPSVEDPP